MSGAVPEFAREAPERAIGSDRRAGKWGLFPYWLPSVFSALGQKANS